MQLATLASSRRLGISLDHVRDEFNVSHRTAQRMMRALENQFPEVETLKDADVAVSSNRRNDLNVDRFVSH